MIKVEWDESSERQNGNASQEGYSWSRGAFSHQLHRARTFGSHCHGTGEGPFSCHIS